MKKSISLLLIAILLISNCSFSFAETVVKGASQSYCTTCKKYVWPMMGIDSDIYECCSDTQHYRTVHYYYYCYYCGNRVDRNDIIKTVHDHELSNNRCIYCGYTRSTSPGADPTIKPGATGRKNIPITYGIDLNAVYSFPQSNIKNRNALCKKQGGMMIEEFGSACSDGCALRNKMEINDRTRIGTLHGFEIVYVYFSVYDTSGRKWYYVVTNSGLEGFVVQSRLTLTGIQLDD